MNKKPTPKELEAIELVKRAIKELPRTIYFDVDTFDGEVQFWKRQHPGIAHGVGEPLKCKRAVVGP